MAERPIEELGPEVEERLRAFKANQERIQEERARNISDSYVGFFRAWAIIGVITGGLLASEKADTGPSDIVNRGIDIVNNLNGPTKEQKKAEFLFRAAPEGSFVHDLVAIGDVDENGKRIPVKLRNRPATEWSFPAEDFNIDDGNDKGELELDQPIEKALMSWGENPVIGDGNDRSIWLIIQDDNGDVYFASTKAGWTGLADEADAPVFDLREVELP